MIENEANVLNTSAWNERLRGKALIEEGRFDLALTHLLVALGLFETSNDKIWIAHTLLDIGRVKETVGNIEDAKLNYTKAVILFEEIGFLQGALMADSSLASIAAKRQDRKGERFHWNKVLENSRRLGLASTDEIQVIVDGVDNPQAVSFGKGVNHRGAPR